MIKTIAYSFDNSGKILYRCVQDGPPPCDPSNKQPLAENIDALTLGYAPTPSYIFTTGLPCDPGTTPNDADPTNDTSNIQTVNICITARTPKPDPTYKDPTDPYNHYRRVTVTSQVTPRNLP